MKIDMAAMTIQGARKSQQDNHYYEIKEEYSVACVCDGMGGHEGGRLASQIVVDTFIKDINNVSQYESYVDFLRKEADKLDDLVYRLKNEHGDWLGAGTTFLAVLVVGMDMYWVNVGDSKLYILREGRMQCATRQHNYKMILDSELAQGIINNDIYVSEQKDCEKLVSYLGMGDMSIIDLTRNPFKTCTGDIYFLCTDGVYRFMSEKDLFQIIKDNNNDIKNASCLIKERLEKIAHSKQDNATAIIIKVG